MEKLNTNKSLHATGYESPRVDIVRINVRTMLCSSLYGGTENMRRDGSLDPTENGGIENMGVETIDF